MVSRESEFVIRILIASFPAILEVSLPQVPFFFIGK